MAHAENAVFEERKRRILAELAQPAEDYADASPKGSVDVQIGDLVNDLNSFPGCVTTSSCAGRIAIYADGASKGTDATGGKGGGGHWLFVSHDPVVLDANTTNLFKNLGLVARVQALNDTESSAEKTNGLVHFKFEPFILHILVDSMSRAQQVLGAAQQAGFRESGISSTSSECPMVAVRTAGLALESIIGFREADESFRFIVDQSYVALLVQISNERFRLNEQRRDRFLSTLRDAFFADEKTTSREDKTARRRRKQEEGRLRQQEVAAQKAVAKALTSNTTEDMQNLFQNS